MARDINLPVGEGCQNLASDVITLQQMLNNVPLSRGGPDYDKKLPTDGKPSGEFVMALHNFQSKNPDMGHEWTKVSPGGITLARLNEFDPLPALKRTSRMACPHGGMVTVLSTGKPSVYDETLGLASQAMVSGCPNRLGVLPSPCIKVQWVTSHAPNFLDSRATGICLGLSGAAQGQVVIMMA
jgi:hypothetical protein